MFNIIAGAFIALFTAFNAKKAGATPTTLTPQPYTAGVTASGGKYDALYKKYATSRVDWKLLKAIAKTESSENPKAINRSDPSYGLGQVLCNTQSIGSNQVCTNALPAVPEFKSMTPQKLLDAETNVRIFSKIIDDNVRKYGLERGIATYNRWASRLENKPFTNQRYVDTVLTNYQRL